MLIKKYLKKLSLMDYILILLGFVVLALILIFIPRKREEVYVYTVNFQSNQWMETPFPDYFWVANNFKNGDIAYDTRGVKVGTVTEVSNTDWGGQRRYLLMKLKMNALLDSRTKQYRVGDVPIEIGSPLNLKINNSNYQGLVTYVGTSLVPPNSEYKKMEIELKVPNVEPWQANSYNDKFIVKNTSGEELFRITKADVRPTERSVNTADGRIVRSQDPYYKDIFVTAKIKVLCQQGICYFNEYVPIKIGGWFWTQSDNALISGEARILEYKFLDN